MPVFRVEKNKGYTVMSNHHLRNKDLSLKAKGLLSQMLSLPEDWDYTLKGLALINREKIDAIRQAIRELEQAGYIVRSRERDERGRLRGADYVIYEQPQTPPALDLPTLENPTLDNPTQEKPTLENPTQLNKDRVNKDQSITDASITHSIHPLPLERLGLLRLRRRKGKERKRPRRAPLRFIGTSSRRISSTIISCATRRSTRRNWTASWNCWWKPSARPARQSGWPVTITPSSW